VTKQIRQSDLSGSARRGWLFFAVLLTVSIVAWSAWGATNVTDATAPDSTPTPTLAPGTGAVAGTAWEDLNANGIWDAGEPVLPGFQVTLWQNDQPLLGIVTGADGVYRFTALAPGIYQITATPPAGYQLTTAGQQTIFISAGVVLTVDFGAVFVPTPTPTATPIPMIDINSATFAYCGGVVQADTRSGTNHVTRYACRPEWSEEGPEMVYRVELGRAQTLTAMLLTTAVDLDLFLLPSAYPETCLAGADATLSYDVQPGVYYVVVDGYQGAAGAFQMRLDCPFGAQATATPTRTPSPTFTPSPALPPTATPTPSPTSPPQYSYLPLVQHTEPGPTPAPITLILQEGADGYVGASDTWISAWPNEDVTPHGSDELLVFRYNRQTTITTHKAPLIRYDLAALPTGANISSAQLALFLVQPPADDVRGAVHGMLRAWDEATATWLAPAPGLSWDVQGAQGIDTDHMGTASDVQQILEGERWYTFDVTQLAQLWSRDPAQNDGLILLARAGDDDYNVEARFASSDYADQQYRPRLVITYWVR
jgi:hypothetical protein